MTLSNSCENLTEDEKAILLKYGQCPDCGGDRFLAGPEGGMNQNIKCAGCGSKFNVCPPWFAERI
jgi:ribosomal protein S27AE